MAASQEITVLDLKENIMAHIMVQNDQHGQSLTKKTDSDMFGLFLHDNLFTAGYQGDIAYINDSVDNNATLSCIKRKD